MADRDWFTYSAEFLPLAINTTATVLVSVQADSDFLLTEITGDVRADDTTETVIAQPAILALLVDQGVGRYLMDRAQMWDNLIGTAERPFILPVPKLFRASSTIQVTLTMGNVAAGRNCRVALHGYKVFKS